MSQYGWDDTTDADEIQDASGGKGLRKQLEAQLEANKELKDTLAKLQTQMRAQTPLQRPSQDGRQLIAALDACQQYVEESRRVVCENKARKTGGQGIQLGFSAPSQPGDRLDRQDP